MVQSENRRRAAERRRADDEVRQAVTGILDRARCRISAALAMEIHQAYTGRGWIPGRLGPDYCPNHKQTRTPCGLCPPGA